MSFYYMIYNKFFNFNLKGWYRGRRNGWMGNSLLPCEALANRLAPTTAKKSRFFKIFCRSPSSMIIDHKTNLLSGYLTNSTVWMAISNSSFVAMMSTLTVLSCA